MTCRLLIDYQVIEFLESLPPKDRRLLRGRFLAIQNDPQNFSDYVGSAGASHRVDINLHGKFAIKYWQDHADQHVKILDITLADKRDC